MTDLDALKLLAKAPIARDPFGAYPGFSRYTIERLIKKGWAEIKGIQKYDQKLQISRFGKLKITSL